MRAVSLLYKYTNCTSWIGQDETRQKQSQLRVLLELLLQLQLQPQRSSSGRNTNTKTASATPSVAACEVSGFRWTLEGSTKQKKEAATTTTVKLEREQSIHEDNGKNTECLLSTITTTKPAATKPRPRWLASCFNNNLNDTTNRGLPSLSSSSSSSLRLPTRMCCSAATLLFASSSPTSAAFDSFAVCGGGGICGDSSKNWSPSASTAPKKGTHLVITIIPLIKPLLIRDKQTQAPTFRALFDIGFRFMGCVCWPFS
mmetsp:Transcript_27076/g.56743  ORF Transcript_27076/g.56743 Transcript_27076/m.56743 type:complete len:257 (-) Transcript_27076:396-1166(-)